MSCTKRVVDALRSTAGVISVELIPEVKPLTLTIRFDPQIINQDRIGQMAKEALESDPDNTGPVSVNSERENS